jgi:hypothetical protein
LFNKRRRNMKILIWVMLVIGLVYLMVGSAIDDGKVVVGGLVLLAVGIALAVKGVQTLSKEQVVDDWSILVEGGAGKADSIFKETSNYVVTSKAPKLKVQKQQVAAGVVNGLIGERREYLIATDQRNGHLEPYLIYLNARDYGVNLAVDWHLTYQPPLWKALVSLLLMQVNLENPLLDLTVFDQEDLRAYATNVHHCLIRAVENLMLSLEQDPSKIERKSRGLLGIS